MPPFSISEHQLFKFFWGHAPHFMGIWHLHGYMLYALTQNVSDQSKIASYPHYTVFNTAYEYLLILYALYSYIYSK